MNRELSYQAPYDRLVAAASRLMRLEVFDADDDISDRDADEFLRVNADTLQDAMDALRAGECRAVVEVDEQFYPLHIDNSSWLLKLSRSFSLQARQCERGGDVPDALAAGVVALDVANAVRRGGLSVAMQISNIAESIAVGRLRRLHRRASAEDARNLAAELLRVDAQREVYEAIVARDKAWEELANMPRETADFLNMQWPADVRETIDPDDEQYLREAMQSLADLPEYEFRAKQQQHDDRCLALLRLLAIEAALVAYRRAHGEYPVDLNALMPDFLARRPMDPFAEQEPFRYRCDSLECLVYSPGPTGIDHGGSLGCWNDVAAGNADLGLNVGDFSCDRNEQP